jgi:ribosome-associated heat shock protein Hsp15
VPAGLDRQRIDKWLWHARLVRTRGAAAALAGSGHVRVNGARIVAPGRSV